MLQGADMQQVIKLQSTKHFLLTFKSKELGKQMPILNKREYNKQCFDAVGWAAGRASGL